MFSSDYDLDTADMTLYAEMWTSLKSFIPTKDRSDAAEQFVSFLVDNGIADIEIGLDELVGSCNILDKAVVVFKRENADEEEFDDEY